MLTLGVLLLLMTGVCWVGIAAVVRDSACHDLDIGRIQFYTSGALVLIASVGLLLHLPLSGSWQNRLLVSIPVFFAGVANFVMLSLMKSGMAYGNPGAVWGIVQSAFICPFLMGIICFGVAPAFSRITGILLIIAGIALFSRDQPQRKSRGCSWLLPTLVAFPVAGLGQCFGNLPSYMTSLDMPPVFRVILVQGGTVAAFAASFMFRNGVKTEKNLRPVWKPVVLLTMVQLISLFFCF